MAPLVTLLRFSSSQFQRVWSHPVTRNVAALYALQIAGYIIPLLTFPYLARVLRPEGFGMYLFAVSFASWSSLVIEYGFNLSATRDVARSGDSRQRISEVAAGVLGAKTILLAGVALLSFSAAFTVSTFREHPAYLLWCIPQIIALGFSPFWYFQGTERMVRAVSLEFAIRSLAAMLVFVIVTRETDGWKALALQASTGFAITAVQSLWMYREVPFSWPNWRETKRSLAEGWNVFVFRSTSNILVSANAFVLGLLSTPLAVGFFGGAERISRALQGCTSPLTQALYPRLSQMFAHRAERAARLARLSLALSIVGGIVIGCALAGFAPLLTRLLLGRGYEGSVNVLRIFALLIPVSTANQALMIHWMLPMRMDRMVSTTVAIGVVANVGLAFLLVPRFAHNGMATAVVITQALMLIVNAAALLRRRTRNDAIASAPGASVEIA